MQFWFRNVTAFLSLWKLKLIALGKNLKDFSILPEITGTTKSIVRWWDQIPVSVGWEDAKAPTIIKILYPVLELLLSFAQLLHRYSLLALQWAQRKNVCEVPMRSVLSATGSQGKVVQPKDCKIPSAWKGFQGGSRNSLWGQEGYICPLDFTLKDVFALRTPVSTAINSCCA